MKRRRAGLRLHRDEDGQMAIAMILTLLVVFLFFALAFDAGLWYFDHRTAQNQADAAALAGALDLPDTAEAQTAVNKWLDRNGSSAAEISCLDITADKVEVCVQRSSPGVFAALSGIDWVKISARAVAMRIAQPVPFALMAMNESECSSLHLTGGSLINVDGTDESAGTYTRSDCDEALTIDGSNGRLIVGGNNDVYGGANSRCLAGQCDPLPTSQEYFEDPFASVPVPSTAACANPKSPITIPTNKSEPLSPGCYRQLSINGTATLEPGVYILTRGISVSGTMTANNVTFYLTCPGGACNGDVPQAFNVSAEAEVTLSGREEFENIAIFADRTAGTNTGQDLITVQGDGSSTFSGAVYAIAGGVSFTGQSGTFPLNVAIVADTITLGGGAMIDVTYDIDLIPPHYKLALIE
ncbi:MAG: pilus assembly protein TadG-related protein [Dehalococcoidia bacterium]|nr:pilus assembly protein TadG-related protein [Dehalococcoidia bacterium]